MKNISELAYELYKLDWKKNHMITAEIEQDMLKDYYEGLAEFDGSYTFDNYIEEFGYYGEIYACYDEFMDSEYIDTEYMDFLFDNDVLYKEYTEDLHEHLALENELSNMYSELHKTTAKLKKEYKDNGESDWAAHLKAQHERTNKKIGYMEDIMKMAPWRKVFKDIDNGKENNAEYSIDSWSLGFNELKDKDFEIYYENICILKGNVANKNIEILNAHEFDNEFIETFVLNIEKILPDYHLDIKFDLLIPVNINGHWCRAVENADYFKNIDSYTPQDYSDGFGYDVVRFKVKSFADLSNVIINESDIDCIYDSDIERYTIDIKDIDISIDNGSVIISPKSLTPFKEEVVSLEDRINIARNNTDKTTNKRNNKTEIVR